MTLGELIPTLGRSLPPRGGERLWPHGVDEEVLASAVAAFGTPVYVLSEDDVREQCRRFRAALPDAEIAYASKALSCRAVVRWVADEGLSLDVWSAGELAVAAKERFPAERILFHGNAKAPDDLDAARAYRVGRIVVDDLDELDRIADQDVLLRVLPGRFGLDEARLEQAVAKVRQRPDLRLKGLHCHIGSQIRHVASYEEAARRMIGLAKRHDLRMEQLDLGGGFGVPHTSAEGTFDLNGYADRVTRAIRYECARHRLKPPRLVVEPGRAIVAKAGVAVYRVTSVNHPFVVVDGGVGDDHPARYEPRVLNRRGRTTRMTLVGRRCEAGGVIAEGALLVDVRPGDLVALPVAGAYHFSPNHHLVGVRDERHRNE